MKITDHIKEIKDYCDERGIFYRLSENSIVIQADDLDPGLIYKFRLDRIQIIIRFLKRFSDKLKLSISSEQTIENKLQPLENWMNNWQKLRERYPFIPMEIHIIEKI